MKYSYSLARKAGLVGAGVGLVLFALYGFLQGSLIGGSIGLGFLNSFYYGAAETSLVFRVLIAVSMITGVFVSAVVFIVLSVAVFWLGGYLLGLAVTPHVHMEHKGHAN